MKMKLFFISLLVLCLNVYFIDYFETKIQMSDDRTMTFDVLFFDSDGTMLNKQSKLPEGKSINYVGSDPINSFESSTFVGWDIDSDGKVDELGEVSETRAIDGVITFVALYN